MAFLGQLDNLRPVTLGKRGTRIVRSMFVFSDGAVICPMGNERTVIGFGAIGALLGIGVRRAVRKRRQTALGDAAAGLGDAGSAQEFAQSRNNTQTIMASDIRRVEIQDGDNPVLAIYVPHPAKPGEELWYGYAAPGRSAADLHRLLSPLAGSRVIVKPA